MTIAGSVPAAAPVAPWCRAPACDRRDGEPEAVPRQEPRRSFLWLSAIPSRRSRRCSRR